MKRFWAPNLEHEGRLARSLGASALLGTSAWVADASIGLATILAVTGVFSLIGALRGWCVLRACGFSTRFGILPPATAPRCETTL